MKEHMYTYHYYRQRGISKEFRIAQYVFYLSAVCFVFYAVMLFAKMIKL